MAQNNTKKTAKQAHVKHRSMTWKERLGVTAAILAAVALCIVMVLNIRFIPYESVDENGRTVTTHISLLQQFRNRKPFDSIEGDLDSKSYELDPLIPKEWEGQTAEESFNDGLDLEQIQEGQFTVLFLGFDEGRSNTDVMMLAMFDIANNKVNILQIPRDTFVPAYTSFEAGKLNSVYSMGDPDKKPIQRVVDCLEETFMIPIDRYVTTGCKDIDRIVDLVGGVPIDMPYRIEFEAGKIIEQGQQVLTGEQAEWLVRYRHGYSEGDIGRMQAQRIFMAAAMAKACDIGTIKLISYMKTITDEKLVGSNLSIDEMSKLADFATTIGMDRIKMYMLPGEGVNYYPENWQAYDHYSVWSIHRKPTIDLLNMYFRPYFEPLFDLPIKEVVHASEYKNTQYDDNITDLQAIEDGDTFSGK